MAIEGFEELNRQLASWPGRLAFVGTGKNAGKTSLLNHVVGLSAPNEIGLSSIGRDGEAYDLIELHEKPRISIRKGTCFATAEQSLERSQGSFRVEEQTSVSTALGRILIARASSQCCVELAGPSTASQLEDIAARLEARGARRILIDGAFGRLALASASLADGVVLAAGAAGKAGVREVVTELACLVRCFLLPVWGREAGLQTAPVSFCKSLTDDALPSLAPRQAVVLPDPAACLLDAAGWNQLDHREIRLFVRRRPELVAAFTNPFRPHLPPLAARQLLEEARRRCPGTAIFDLALEGALQT